MSTISRTCSQCGNNGHNSRTCTESSGGGTGGAGNDSPSSENGIMLFGVRVTAASGGGGAFRKSASMNNLSQYDQQNQDSNAEVFAAGYASDDLVHASAGSRDRKRGVPWTEEEHKLFLLGLQKVGKGDWRGISRNFVKSRTPTQVASHAQKYFIRRNNHNRRRRRSSLFDMTTDSVMGTGIPEDQVRQDPSKQFPVLVLPKIGEDSMESLTLGQSNKAKNTTSSSSPKLIRPIPFFPIPPSSKMAKLNLNETSVDTETLPLSLKLSTTPSTTDEPSPPPQSAARRSSSAFEAISDNFNSNGDSIISVA